MSWRDRLAVEHSDAEIRIFIELQNRKLTDYVATLDTVILFFQDHFRMRQKEKVTRLEMEFSDGYTIPDFILLPPKKRPIPVYIDGLPVHDKDGARERDERITRRLEEYGLKAMRFTYRPKLTDRECALICDDLEEAIGIDGEN